MAGYLLVWSLCTSLWLHSALSKRLRSIDRFLQGRRHLKRHIGQLFERSLMEQERFGFDKEIPMLTRKYWIPSKPLPLESICSALETFR